MTKRELVETVYLKTGVQKKDVKTVVDCFLSTVRESVLQGERVDLRGFGVFYLSEKKQRQVFSPLLQKNVDVEAGFNVMFKSSKSNRVTIHKGD